jgi:hypothetical protein
MRGITNNVKTKFMKTKDEILKNRFPNASELDWYKPISEAMNEYAREVHFSYNKWISDIVTTGGERKEQLKKISNEQLFNVFMIECNEA